MRAPRPPHRLAPLLAALAACAPDVGPPPGADETAGLHFRARRELTVPGKPLGLLATDLDGDGRADLVATLQEPGALVIWRQGAGGLAAEPTVIGIGGFPVGPVAVPHADGGPRVAVASMRERELVVLAPASRGDDPVARYALPATPRALAASEDGAALAVALDDGTLALANADGLGPARPAGFVRPTCVALVDGGRLVAVGSQLPPRVALFDAAALSDGSDGPLEPVRVVELAGIPRALLEHDLDRDGDRELVVAGGDRALFVLGLGDATGAGPWTDASAPPRTVPATGNVPLAAAAADLGGDGADELVLLCTYDSAYGVLGGFDAAAGWCTPVWTEYAGQTPRALAVADFDGDGAPDLAVANRDAARVSLLPGAGREAAGEPVFHQAPRVPVGRTPLDLAAADFDGDGRPEVAVVGASSGVLTLLANRAGTLFRLRDAGVGPAPSRVLAGDLDADGHADLLVLRRPPEGARLRVLFGDGAGGLDARGLDELDAGAGVRDVALLGRPGARPWIVSADETGQRVVALVPTRSGEPWAVARTLETPLAPQPGALCALPDGRLAVALGGDEPAVATLEVADGRLVERRRFRTQGAPELLRAGDLDGDGETDLVLLAREVRGGTQGWLLPLLARGDSFRAQERVITGLSPAGLGVGDLDGDGRADVVVAAQNSHHANLWLAGRDGRLARRPDLGAGIGCLAVELADLDADGRLDVLVANAFSDDVSVIANER